MGKSRDPRKQLYKGLSPSAAERVQKMARKYEERIETQRIAINRLIPKSVALDTVLLIGAPPDESDDYKRAIHEVQTGIRELLKRMADNHPIEESTDGHD